LRRSGMLRATRVLADIDGVTAISQLDDENE
jgi:hypothetical protein